MKVSDIVWVEMKYGTRLMGQIINFGMDGIFVRPFDSPRMIIARPEDLTTVGAA